MDDRLPDELSDREAQIYAKYILQEKPDAKIGILYQNDDYGKDYPAGKDVLADKWDRYVVKAVTYEVTDPTIEFTDHQFAGSWLRCAAHSGNSQICRANHPQDVRPQLETAARSE